MSEAAQGNLMRFPSDAIPELPLATSACPRCDIDVIPFEQATCMSAIDTVIDLAHYRCPCGCTWGKYYPQRGI